MIGGDGAVGEEASASPNANALTSVLVEATSHPNLFAFSQFLALPNLLQVLLSPIIIVGASVYRFYTFNEYYFIDFCFHSFSMTLQLQATENSVYLDMLRLFAHGTWSDYKSKHVDNGFTFYVFFFFSLCIYCFGFLVVLICLSLVTMVFRLLLLFDCFKNFFCLFLYLLFLILIGSFFFH